MGVDYTGVFNLYALGAGTIRNVTNSGWPGGTFIGLELEDGSGRFVYYAENIAPAVRVGQHVTAGQLVGRARGTSPYTEIGWAAPPGTGETMAAKTGQVARGQAAGDPGRFSTAYGVNFSNLVVSLGGPAGIVVPPIQGTVPASWGSGTAAAQTAASAAATASDLISAALAGAAIPGVMVLVLFAGAAVLAAVLTAAAIAGAAYVASRD
jgi:hypothetical protein